MTNAGATIAIMKSSIPNPSVDKALKAQFVSVERIETDPGMALNVLQYCTPSAMFQVPRETKGRE